MRIFLDILTHTRSSLLKGPYTCDHFNHHFFNEPEKKKWSAGKVRLIRKKNKSKISGAPVRFPFVGTSYKMSAKHFAEIGLHKSEMVLKLMILVFACFLIKLNKVETSIKKPASATRDSICNRTNCGVLCSSSYSIIFYWTQSNLGYTSKSGYSKIKT